MTNKKLDVLNYLQKNSTWKTAAEISSALGYSVRSIKSYIHELNEEKPDMILSSKKGFCYLIYPEFFKYTVYIVLLPHILRYPGEIHIGISPGYFKEVYYKIFPFVLIRF